MVNWWQYVIRDVGVEGKSTVLDDKRIEETVFPDESVLDRPRMMMVVVVKLFGRVGRSGCVVVRETSGRKT